MNENDALEAIRDAIMVLRTLTTPEEQLYAAVTAQLVSSEHYIEAGIRFGFIEEHSVALARGVIYHFYGGQR